MALTAYINFIKKPDTVPDGPVKSIADPRSPKGISEEKEEKVVVEVADF